jgi:hypothetical protein
MLTFLKGFKSLLNKQVQQLILLAIGVLVLIQALDGNSDFLPFLITLLPLLLFLGSVFLLANLGHLFAAYVVMFIYVFDDGIRNFLYAITSYSFSTEEFTANFDVYLFLTAIVGVYLLFMIISYALSGEISFKLNIKPVLFPMFIFSIWCYVCYGFSATLIIILLSILAVSYGSILASLMIMLSVAISWPLIIIDYIVEDSVKFTNITFWLIALSSFYVIYILVKQMIHHKDTLKIKEV